jgi:hypothetical protein
MMRRGLRRSHSDVTMPRMCRLAKRGGRPGHFEWRDPLGVRGCGFFWVKDDRIMFQRVYWDKLLVPQETRPANQMTDSGSGSRAAFATTLAARPVYPR